MEDDEAKSVAPRRRRSAGRSRRTVIRHTDAEWTAIGELADELGVSIPGLYEYAVRVLSTAQPASVARAEGERTSRRSRAGGGARPHRTIIRHSDAEWARITASAAALGCSVPAFYERAVFAGGAQAAVQLSIIEDQLFGVRRLLANAANNLNQVARSLNTDGTYEPGQLTGSLRLFETTVGRLNALLDQLPEYDQ